jgi:hypothetical protein
MANIRQLFTGMATNRQELRGAIIFFIGAYRMVAIRREHTGMAIIIDRLTDMATSILVY